MGKHRDVKGINFCLNDQVDLVMEILKRLDDRSLGVAACVCKLWCSITRNDSFWENLCFSHELRDQRHSQRRLRDVVVALGGYRRLYVVCMRPLLSNRLGTRRIVGGGGGSNELTRDEVHVQLSLSLYCVDYYERLGSGGGGGERYRDDASASSSLMFLCSPVNV